MNKLFLILLLFSIISYADYDIFDENITCKNADTKFINFMTSFNIMRSHIRNNDFKFFTNVECIDDGILRITVTESWLASPSEYRIKTINKILNLWDKSLGNDDPIFIHIIDRYGTPHLYETSLKL